MTLSEGGPLRRGDVVLREESFRLLRLPIGRAGDLLAELVAHRPPFWFASLEEEGFTLLLPAPYVDRVAHRLTDATFETPSYRVITFVPTLAWTVVGFLAAVSRELAIAAIPIGAISAFDRDHLFVQEDLAERAMATLHDAIDRNAIP